MESRTNQSFNDGFIDYQLSRVHHWEKISQGGDTKQWAGWFYHERLTIIYQFLIPPGLRVIEIGCGHGDLLAALKPAYGLGIDFSPNMIETARQRHPELNFLIQDAHSLSVTETFNVIILSDLVNDLWDVQKALEILHPLCNANTRIILNTYSRLWQIPLNAAEALGMAKSTLDQNWIAVEDIHNMLALSGFEVIRSWQEFLCPLPVPIIKSLLNQFLVKIWPFNYFALTNFLIARPAPKPIVTPYNFKVSIIIPARNEAGNVESIFNRTPQMGVEMEIVFVEGHSTDDTRVRIEQEINKHPERNCQLLIQTGTGKGDAVRLGFSRATGNILMILDADLTVAPEDLPRFYQALVTGKGEFINGVRLVYPLADHSMRFLNLIGNKFFSWAFSWLLGQPVKDTLCGTKALWKRDYDRISANRSYFGDFDPFGDYDLLFGAARLNLKIVDLPIRYRERVYGTTNIRRWKHGWLLFKMTYFAAKRLKFV